MKIAEFKTLPIEEKIKIVNTQPDPTTTPFWLERLHAAIKSGQPNPIMFLGNDVEQEYLLLNKK